MKFQLMFDKKKYSIYQYGISNTRTNFQYDLDCFSSKTYDAQPYQIV